MKRIVELLALCLVATTLVWGAEPTKTAVETIKPVPAIMAEIRQATGVSDDSRIDPAQVPDALLEDLGESAMEDRLGNAQLHEWMANMMGGEGSASLAAMRRQVGYNYLRGGRGGMMPGTMGGMMGQGRPGDAGFLDVDSTYPRRPMMSGRWNHMRRAGFTWARIIAALVVILLLAGIVALVVVVIRLSRPHATPTSALEILKTRYARGEINKDEFEAKRKDLL